MVISSAILIHPWHSEDLVHLLLEDVLGADKAKCKSQEAVPSEGTVESCKQAGVLVKDN